MIYSCYEISWHNSAKFGTDKGVAFPLRALLYFHLVTTRIIDGIQKKFSKKQY